MKEEKLWAVVAHFNFYDTKVKYTTYDIKEAFAICRNMNKKYGTKEILDRDYCLDIPDNYNLHEEDIYFSVEEIAIKDNAQKIMIYALQYHDDPLNSLHLVSLAISKEDAIAKIERLHKQDSKNWNKGGVYITPYEIDLSTGEICEDFNTYVGIKELQ